MVSLFFAETISTSNTQVLEKDEAHHAIKVLRLNKGEIIKISDGVKNWVLGPIADISKKSLSISITERGQIQSESPELILVQAITKSDRGKEMLELAVEAGVDQIIPWLSERSISKWQSDSYEKWSTGVKQSCKQARQVKLPRILPAINTIEVAKLFNNQSMGVVFHEGASSKFSQISIPNSLKSIYLIIGPEGGISDQELELFTSNGGKAVRLGETVLRSAHAGFAAISAMQTKLGRW